MPIGATPDPPRPSRGWVFAADRGGTFTDVVATDPAGRTHVRKVLSIDPARPGDPLLRAVRELLGLADGTPIPTGAVGEIRIGTTLATNALLERRAAPVGLAITRGFADLPWIGTQQRPDLFALAIEKPVPLVAREAVIEVEARVRADGTIERPVEVAAVRRDLVALRGRGLDALAVVCCHAYAFPAQEREIAALAREAGFAHVVCSHEAAPELGLVARLDTTLADAALTPILRRYLDGLAAGLPAGVRLRVFQSQGAVADAAVVRGKDTVLSGPAGGVTALARLAAAGRHPRLLGFDMGGTSTDVSRIDGEPARVPGAEVGGVRVRAPMLEVVSVAAGGGSRMAFDGRRLLVGPESGGADPGPAGYGRGGPATITDANAVLGRIQPRFFPRCFGPAGDAPFDVAAARAALEPVAAAMGGPDRGTTTERAAAGAVRVANAAMAEAIKRVSAARGIDPRGFALCGFGAAAGQHACAVAERLGIRTVILHPLAGVLSAWGIAGAGLGHSDVRAVLAPLDAATLRRLAEEAGVLEASGREALRTQGATTVATRFAIDVRVRGADEPLAIAWIRGASLEAAEAAFAVAHRRLYGIDPPAGATLEVTALRAETGDAPAPPQPAAPGDASWRRLIEPGDAVASVTAWFDAAPASAPPDPQPRETPVYDRTTLRAGDYLDGPAILSEPTATTVIDPGWSASLDPDGVLVLTLRSPSPSPSAPSAISAVTSLPDPVLLEVFQHRFMSIAEQMGEVLRRVAHSTNIKERLDFSCALFDRAGRLVANAPHIPVHLGAMGESVAAILAARGQAMRPGESYATNDPYHGGSHLPDVTVITPLFDAGGRRTGFVASRGHWADVGGIVPGSMPPDARTIEEEGVRLHDLLVARDGRILADDVASVLGSGRWPARDIPERLRDLQAQLAANAAGARLVAEAVAESGQALFDAYTDHVRADAAAAMREALAALPRGTHRLADRLDDGTPVAVAVTVEGERVTVDFAGTGPPHPGNLNAPRAVVVAAVLYAFRCLVRRPIPLNAGVLEPIEIRIPPGSLLDPRPPAAVSGGNVETSQRLVDVILGALGVAAASQGTMNNLTFGTARTAHYETICGGAGAGPGFAGADAVHTHMTNTRATDPEVLERRHPVVLRAFAIRRGSGGAGRWPGGDGVRRALEFREPMTVSIVSERRATSPFGLAGGGPGQPGRNLLIRGGRETALGGRVTVQVLPGDVLVIETPGGGGCGNARG